METQRTVATVTEINMLEVYKELSEIEFHFLCINDLPPHYRFTIMEYLAIMKSGALKAKRMANSGADAYEILECIKEGFRTAGSLMAETKELINVVFSDSTRYELGCRDDALEMGEKVEKLIKKYAPIMPQDAIE